MAGIRGKESIGSRAFDVANVLFLLLLAVTFVYPFWVIILQAFSSLEDLYRLGLHVWNSDWRTEPLVFVMQEERVGLAYFNTIFRVVFGTLATLLVTFSGAYALSKRNLPFRKSVTALYLMTLFFSGGLIPTYLLVRNLGLLNTRLALILPVAVQVFYIIIARNFLMTIDQAYEESAMIDGAGYVQILTRIIVPLSKPIIATIWLWAAVYHWNEWFHALIFTQSREKHVMQFLLRRMLQTIHAVQLEMVTFEEDITLLPYASVRAAVTLLTIGPIIFIYPFVQRYFIRGIFVGSLKG